MELSFQSSYGNLDLASIGSLQIPDEKSVRCDGQYIVYHDVLAQVEPDRELFLAVSAEVASGLFEEPIGELLLKNNRVRLLVFEPDAEAIVKWIP